MSKTVSSRAAGMRKFALSLPEAREDFPWGERVIKVKDKVFVFLGKTEDHPENLTFSVKLPSSGSEVLGLPHAAPTGYGLGKSGWVTFRFRAAEAPPIELLCHWIEESYRAVAPKSVAKRLDGAPSADGGKKAPPAEKGAPAKALAKRVSPAKKAPRARRNA